MLISAGRLLQRALDTPSLSYGSLRRAGLSLKYLYRLARLPEGDGGETAAVTLLADACKAGARPGWMLERLCNDLYARTVERERSRGLKDAAELEIPPETAAPGNEDDAHPGPPGVTGRELLKCLHALTLAAAPVERTTVDKVLATAGDTQEIRRMADGLGASLQLVMDKVDWLRKHLA